MNRNAIQRGIPRVTDAGVTECIGAVSRFQTQVNRFF